ncbi:uncharacterized protein METZ01_LOCUS328834, partial [marine metagenome]
MKGKSHSTDEIIRFCDKPMAIQPLYPFP